MLQNLIVSTLLLVLATVSHSLADTRIKCSVALPNPDNIKILYYQLTGDEDVVHYVWSLVDSPTLYLSITNSSMDTEDCNTINDTINWNRFPKHGSAFIPGANGTFAFMLVFSQLYEFKDVNFNAYKDFHPSNLSNSSNYRSFSLSGLNWKFVNSSSEQQLLNATDNANTTKKFNWLIKIQVPVVGDQRLPYFPKTLYTENSTTFDFIFKNFHYELSRGDNQDGRLVLEMTMVHGPLQNGTIQQSFSRDDEYTPSIFRTYSYLFRTVESPPEGTQGYLQWKPISYLSPDRKSTSSQQINLVPAGNSKEEVVPLGLASALFNNETAGNITTVYFVMGTEKDDNNANPSFVTWTALLGFGIEPTDTISWTVIITIIVGLGIPALLVAIGGVYVVVKKKPWGKLVSKEKNGYNKIDGNVDKVSSE